MKKTTTFYTYILFVMTLIGFTSCKEDFLERPPQDALTDGTFFNTGDELLLATAPLYNKVWFDYNDKASFGIGDARGGNMISNDYDPFYKFALPASNNQVIEAWKSFYSVIAQSNMVIYNVNNRAAATIPALYKKHAIGEARFMRGLAYAYLVRNWGAVPIIDNNVKQLTDTSIARNTVSSVWEFVIRDLRYAAQNLPATSLQTGRINKYSAEGMLAKMYLTRAGVKAVGGIRDKTDLDSAKYYAKDVILNGPFKMMANYPDLFKLENKNNDEALFALRWTLMKSDFSDYGVQNTFQAYMAADTKITGSWDGWGGAHGASADYLKSVDPADSIRRKATFMMYNDRYTELVKNEGGYTFTSTNIANVKKYIIGSPTDNGEGSPMNTAMCTYMMRLPELYLIYAEAILGDNASTSDAEALKYFNAVRTRAKMPTKTAITFDDIFKEKRVECAMEGNYWYELVRLYYFNPTKAKAIISAQDKGSYTVAIEAGTGTSASNPRKFKITYSNQTYKVDDSTFWIPYPESEMAKAPNLRKTPVDYKF